MFILGSKFLLNVDLLQFEEIYLETRWFEEMTERMAGPAKFTLPTGTR